MNKKIKKILAITVASVSLAGQCCIAYANDKVETSTISKESSVVKPDVVHAASKPVTTSKPSVTSRKSDTSKPTMPKPSTFTSSEVETSGENSLFIDVKDIDTKAVIEGVVISIKDINGKEIARVKTGKNGHAEYKNIDFKHGYYTVELVSVPAGYKMPVDQERILECNFKESHAAGYCFFYISKNDKLKTTRYKFTVIDGNTKERIPYTKVELYMGGKKYTNVADKNGEVVFDIVKNSEYYELQGIKDGYTPYWSPREGTDYIDVVRLWKIYPLKRDLVYKVKDVDTKKPIKGFEVKFYSRDGKYVGKAVTDENGIAVLKQQRNNIYYAIESKAPAGYSVNRGRKKYMITDATAYDYTLEVSVLHKKNAIRNNVTDNQNSNKKQSVISTNNAVNNKKSIVSSKPKVSVKNQKEVISTGDNSVNSLILLLISGLFLIAFRRKSIIKCN